MYTIAHLSSVHPRYDTRIFLKECTSLANAGYTVHLVIADDNGDETNSGVQIHDVGLDEGRINRMLKTTKRVYQKALELDADIYHLHDPELMPIGRKLKKKGKQVIFDAHEDLPKQILGKPYLKPIVKKVLSTLIRIYEERVCKSFDTIVTATPFIRDKFLAINKKSIDINNYPILGELSNTTSYQDKKNEICYVGGIAEVRGIREMVKALEYMQTTTKLNLGGSFSEKEIESEVKAYAGWEKVNKLGYLNREEVAQVFRHSKIGLVTLLPIINYIDSLPVKMFEYMVAGLPVIASDFPLWKTIIEGNNCGICVDPLNPQAIAKAIDYIINDPKEAEQMGKNGQQAVRDKYNWSVEERKLLALYSNL